MVCSKRRGRPGAESLLWVTVPREVSGGKWRPVDQVVVWIQHCNGGGYRADPGPEERSLCESGYRHGARRTLQKEAFPKVGQNMPQRTGYIAMASCPCQGLASDLDLGQPS